MLVILMNQTGTINTQIEPDLKIQAESILKRIGFSSTKWGGYYA